MRPRLFFAALLLALAPAVAAAADITVFGAASLSDALNEIAKNYQQQSGKTVAVSPAASSALAPCLAVIASASAVERPRISASPCARQLATSRS